MPVSSGSASQEAELPDWNYLVLHFAHTLALALWTGGAAVLALLAAPALRRHLEPSSARLASDEIHARFDRLTLACALVLWITSALMILAYGRLSPWYAIQYVCIGMMSASALFSVWVTAPRLARLRERRASGESEIQRLRQTSGLAHQFNVICALVALFFS